MYGGYSVLSGYDQWSKSKQKQGGISKEKVNFLVLYQCNGSICYDALIRVSKKRPFVTFFLFTGKMPAAERGAQAAPPQQALGGCGDSTQKIHRGSKCKSWEQTLCFCPESQSPLAALCLCHQWCLL